MSQRLSPQGYNYGKDPANTNPFWGEGGGGGGSDEVWKPVLTPIEDGYEMSWEKSDSVEAPTPVDILNGVDGHDGQDGQDGAPGEKGDKGDKGDPGEGIPTGGTTGQVLKKRSNANYDVEWADESGGGGGTTPVISATASVDNTSGTPGVTVTKSGTDAAPSFAFAFTGLKGAQGEQGIQGIQGEQGVPGQNGTNGTDGTDGVSPTVNITSITGGHRVSITDAQGTDTFDVMDGTDGAPGAQGADGTTPNVTATATTGNTGSSTPSVSVSRSGTQANPSFDFTFNNLNGGQVWCSIPATALAGDTTATIYDNAIQATSVIEPFTEGLNTPVVCKTIDVYTGYVILTFDALTSPCSIWVRITNR